MDWWVIEYDNKNFDDPVFMSKVQGEFTALMVADGGGPFGTTVYSSSSLASPDNKFRLYFNPKAANIPGVRELLSRYGAKECSKPSEQCSIFAGNHAEPL